MRVGLAAVVLVGSIWLGLVAASGCWMGTYCQCRDPGTINLGRYRVVEGPREPELRVVPDLIGAQVEIAGDRVSIDTDAGRIELTVVGRQP